MAYNHDNFDLVNLIDEINGTLWPFVKPRERVIRKKKPPEEKLRERLDILDDKVVTDNTTDNEGTTQESNSVLLSPKLKNEKNVRVKPDAVRLPKNARCITDDKNSRVQTKHNMLPKATVTTPREPGSMGSTLPGIGDGIQSNTRTYRYKYTRDFLARQKDRILQKAACDQHRRFSVGDMPRHLWKTYRRSCATQNNASTHRLHYVNGPDALEDRIQSPTRLLSPWREDDAILLDNLKSRSGTVTHRTQKPTLSRRQALLPLLPENATHRKLHEVIYGERLATPQLPVAKSSRHDFSPAIDRIRQVDCSKEATTSTHCSTPVLPTRCRSTRIRTPETTSKEETYPHAKTHLESVGKKTLRWEFDIDRVVRPTVVRFTAPSPEPSAEADETFAYSVPMTASPT